MPRRAATRIRAADPTPPPKPDRIEPAAPPEDPVRPNPAETPPGHPAEIPGHPGGDATDQPGRGPSEVPEGSIRAIM